MPLGHRKLILRGVMTDPWYIIWPHANVNLDIINVMPGIIINEILNGLLIVFSGIANPFPLDIVIPPDAQTSMSNDVRCHGNSQPLNLSLRAAHGYH